MYAFVTRMVRLLASWVLTIFVSCCGAALAAVTLSLPVRASGKPCEATARPAVPS